MTGGPGPIRHALEIRHSSFETERFVTLLREHDIALVVADTAGKWPFMEDVTADFVYVRLHGDEQLYVSGYTDSALQEWARKVRVWPTAAILPGRSSGVALSQSAAGPRCLRRFRQRRKTRAPYDAMSLASLLGLGPAPTWPPKTTDGLDSRAPAHRLKQRERPRHDTAQGLTKRVKSGHGGSANGIRSSPFAHLSL